MERQPGIRVHKCHSGRFLKPLCSVLPCSWSFSLLTIRFDFNKRHSLEYDMWPDVWFGEKKKQEKLSKIINCLVSSDFVVSIFSWLFFFKVMWMGISRELISLFIPLICLMHSSVVPTAVMLRQVPTVARCFYPSSAAVIAIPCITKVWPAGFVGLSFTLGNKQTLVLFHFLLNW